MVSSWVILDSSMKGSNPCLELESSNEVLNNRILSCQDSPRRLFWYISCWSGSDCRSRNRAARAFWWKTWLKNVLLNQQLTYLRLHQRLFPVYRSCQKPQKKLMMSIDQYRGSESHVTIRMVLPEIAVEYFMQTTWFLQGICWGCSVDSVETMGTMLECKELTVVDLHLPNNAKPAAQCKNSLVRQQACIKRWTA